jgi:hypothetical protein
VLSFGRLEATTEIQAPRPPSPPLGCLSDSLRASRDCLSCASVSLSWVPVVGLVRVGVRVEVRVRFRFRVRLRCGEVW